MLLMIYHRMDRLVGMRSEIDFWVSLDPLHVVDAFPGVALAVKDTVSDGTETVASGVIWYREKERKWVTSVSFLTFQNSQFSAVARWRNSQQATKIARFQKK